MGEVIYRGEEPEFDPTEEDMAAYAKARASFLSGGGTPVEWMEMDRQSKVGLVRGAREQIAAEKEASKVVPLRPLTTL